MEQASMASCSRGQLVKHRYTNQLMSVYLYTADACRCCAGKYSPVSGVPACTDCSAGEMCMLLARLVMPSYPI
jgi:hypothetical protein